MSAGKAILLPAWAVLEAPREVLDKLHASLSYRDKGAEHDLVRFKRAQEFKFRGEDAPAWYGPWYKAELERLKAAVRVHACVPDGDALMVPIGLFPRAMRELAEMGGQPAVEDLRDFGVKRRHLGQGPEPRLRRPQEEALAALEANKGGLVVMATGGGKTLVGEEFIARVGAKSMFLVPSSRILEQTVRRFRKRFGKAMVGEFSGRKKDDEWIVVATYQSVFATKDGDFDDVDVVVMDETHHVAARTFYAVAQERLRNAVYRVGLTADEIRSDGGTLLVNAAVGEAVYRYTARQAIDDGYLARPTHYVYSVRNTAGAYKRWRLNRKTKKREEVGTCHSEPYDGDDEGQAYKSWMLGNDMLNQFVASMAMSLASEGQGVLILCDEIEHGEKLAELLPGFGFVKGGSKDNDWLVDAFNARKLKGLIGTSVIGEGADLVPVDWMFQLQGGASASKARQADGRAFRNDPDPETGIGRKMAVNLVDFDFPLSPVLSRHSEARRAIHAETGDVHELEMP